jgi:aminoglycoside phosphotransferase (APT) family kinase protein
MRSTTSALSVAVLGWAGSAVGAGATVVDVQPLRDSPRDRGPWLLHVDYRGAAIDVVLKTGPAGADAARPTTTPVTIRASMATEAAALTLAEEQGLRAPRVLAVDLDGAVGVIALLSTAIPGHSRVPGLRALRALGAELARLHSIPLTPRPDLPLRTRPRQGDDYITQRRQAARQRDRYRAGTTAERHDIIHQVIAARPTWTVDRAHRAIEGARTTSLLEAAEERLRQLPIPAGPTVFVHDDLCGGNTVWTDSDTVTIIDWEGAGAGQPELDLGNLRFEESMTFGLPAAHEVTEGWCREFGQAPSSLAYWDLQAALNTPADLAGWTTLPDATRRRDEFLQATLDQLT